MIHYDQIYLYVENHHYHFVWNWMMNVQVIWNHVDDDVEMMMMLENEIVNDDDDEMNQN